MGFYCESFDVKQLESGMWLVEYMQGSNIVGAEECHTQEQAYAVGTKTIAKHKVTGKQGCDSQLR
jgi:hypothetical protein